jgi:WD40 repeat protein
MRFHKPVIFLVSCFVLTACISINAESSTKTNYPIVATPMLFQSLTKTPGNALLNYALSPKGDRLAIFSNTRIDIIDLTTMKQSNFIKFENGNYGIDNMHHYSNVSGTYGAIAFSPDEKSLAISGKFANAPITIFELDSKKQIGTISEIPNEYFATEIKFSPNGESLIVRYTNLDACEGPKDKVVLYDVNKGKEVFSIEKCQVYPPLRFSFMEDDRIFLYYGGMSAIFNIYLIDSATGQIISQERFDSEKSGVFYGTSPDGKINLIQKTKGGIITSYLVDSETNKTLKTVEGEIILYYNKESFVVHNYATDKLVFWKNGKIVCEYGEHKRFIPETIQASANRDVFVLMKNRNELQVWKTTSCEMIGEFYFVE